MKRRLFIASKNHASAWGHCVNAVEALALSCILLLALTLCEDALHTEHSSLWQPPASFQSTR